MEEQRLLFSQVTPASAFSNKMISAKAALVMDNTDSVLFEKNANTKLQRLSR